MLVFVLLLVCFAALKAEEFNPLGRAIYLPDYNVMGKLEETGTEILMKSKIAECSITTNEPLSYKTFKFFENTKSFYSTTSSSVGLDTSLQADFTLGFTLDSATKSITGSKRTVTGNSMFVTAATYQTRLYNDCLQDYTHLEQGFKDDLLKLPITVEQPWLESSWTAYDVFIHKYGSHLVTSITYGSSINQMAFADTSESYSERDFQVKSCMAFGKDFEMCSGVSQSEIDKVTSMTMSDYLVVRGGTSETRNSLLTHRTPELVEQFMNEASAVNSTIKYTFTSMWDFLQQTYVGVHDNNFIRAVNMEYYYLGYLNYGCKFKESGGQQLQKFDFTSSSTSSAPRYECSLAHDTCHKDSDCNYKPIWCSCKGDSCVVYKDSTLNTGGKRTDAYANTDSDLGWHGCDWKPWAAGFKCQCGWPSSVRRVVWSRENKALTFLMSDRVRRLSKAKKDEL